MLTAKSITKKYQGEDVIRDVSIDIAQGEVVSLLGVSGVGKSTFMHVAAGLLRPESGRITANCADITGKPGMVSFMPQKDLLLPYKKLIDNVSLPLILKGMPKAQAYETVYQYLDAFMLKGAEFKYPSQLSGGMRQRAALLRTAMFASSDMLLDEPFSALDTSTKQQMYNWFGDTISKFDSSVLLITHDIDEAITLSDSIYIMQGVPGMITSKITIDRSLFTGYDYTVLDSFIQYKRQIKALFS